MEPNTVQSRASLAAELRDLVDRWCAEDNTCDIVGTIECVKADYLARGKSLVTTPFSMEMRELVARWCDQVDFSREDVIGVLECQKYLYLAAAGQRFAPSAGAGQVAA
jgi:hypothetical protein